MAARKVSPDEKALQYIALGRVRIKHLDVDSGILYADVKSASQSGDPYYVRHDGGEWHCDCPARVNPCAHIRALQKVVEFPTVKPTMGVHYTSSIDALLDG